MKKTTKTDAAKAAKPTTPAKPAPSPAKKAKATSTRKLAAVLAAPIPAVNDDVAVAAPIPLSGLGVPSLPTTIVAQIDVGFGNTLYLRGEGPGLSWEKGVPLDCVADDKWSLSVPETAKPIVFKFLINDLTWCSGDDYVAQPGTTLTVSPTF